MFLMHTNHKKILLYLGMWLQVHYNVKSSYKLCEYTTPNMVHIILSAVFCLSLYEAFNSYSSIKTLSN